MYGLQVCFYNIMQNVDLFKSFRVNIFHTFTRADLWSHFVVIMLEFVDFSGSTFDSKTP